MTRTDLQGGRLVRPGESLNNSDDATRNFWLTLTCVIIPLSAVPNAVVLYYLYVSVGESFRSAQRPFTPGMIYIFGLCVLSLAAFGLLSSVPLVYLCKSIIIQKVGHKVELFNIETKLDRQRKAYHNSASYRLTKDGPIQTYENEYSSFPLPVDNKFLLVHPQFPNQLVLGPDEAKNIYRYLVLLLTMPFCPSIFMELVLCAGTRMDAVPCVIASIVITWSTFLLMFRFVSKDFVRRFSKAGSDIVFKVLFDINDNAQEGHISNATERTPLAPTVHRIV